MGAPMTPRPMKPIMRAPPRAARRASPRWPWSGCTRGRSSRRSRCLDRVEHVRVVDLARAGLAAAGRVGELDVADARRQLADRRDEVALGALHVEDVVLELDVRPVHGVHERDRLARGRQQDRAVVVAVDGLDRHVGADRGGLVGGPARRSPRRGRAAPRAWRASAPGPRARSGAGRRCAARARARPARWRGTPRCARARRRAPRSPDGMSPASKFISATSTPASSIAEATSSSDSPPGHQNSTARNPARAARSKRSRNATSLNSVETLAQNFMRLTRVSSAWAPDTSSQFHDTEFKFCHGGEGTASGRSCQAAGLARVVTMTSRTSNSTYRNSCQTTEPSNRSTAGSPCSRRWPPATRRAWSRSPTARACSAARRTGC